MPTGYTAGIIDGDITTFKEFALKCMRAFGATVHMRDEPMDKQYEPRTPSDYHRKEIQRFEGEIEYAQRLSGDELLRRHREKVKEDIKYQRERIEETKQAYERLCSMLKKVREWQPPTSDHTNLKEFMINQLEETIKFDGSTHYHKEKIEELEGELERDSPEEIREEMISHAEERIGYHRKEHDKEVERCASANEWAKKLIESLDE